MRRRTFVATATFAAGLLVAGVAINTRATLAADPGVSGPPSGKLTLTATSAAVGVGYTWGDGTLIFQGATHHFSVQGLSVAAVGYSKIVGHGRVYNLKKLADFSGNYVAATGEATLVNGLGGQILKNANGVEIRIDEVTKGAKLSGSADGIKLTLAR